MNEQGICRKSKELGVTGFWLGFASSAILFILGTFIGTHGFRHRGE